MSIFGSAESFGLPASLAVQNTGSTYTPTSSITPYDASMSNYGSGALFAQNDGNFNLSGSNPSLQSQPSAFDNIDIGQGSSTPSAINGGTNISDQQTPDSGSSSLLGNMFGPTSGLGGSDENSLEQEQNPAMGGATSNAPFAGTSISDKITDLFVRGGTIATGLIFIAVGLTMFRPVQRTVVNVAKLTA